MIKRKHIELLAPAGSKETLVAAVQAGADAVYLAGQRFGARHYAGNFDPAALKEAVEYCHLRDVRVYGAINTLIKEEEMTEALRAAGDMYMAGVDALIVQDWGYAANLRQHLPDLELHGSTQMSIYDAAGVQMAEKLGLKRVVIARETSADTIREITRETAVEVEAFIHGALCYCYSGQCLMSSQIGGRSGNRGRCAQPCRKLYRLRESAQGAVIKEGYLLSTRDLDTRMGLDRILDSGVCSLKIEGRMRKPDYVAAVTGAYRLLIDRHFGSSESANEALPSVEQVFNRESTGGRILGASSDEILNTAAPGNMGNEIGKTHSSDERRKLLTIDLTDTLRVGDGLKIMKADADTGVQVTSIFLNGVQVPEASAGQRVSVPFLRKLPGGLVIRKTLDSQAVSQAEALSRQERHRIRYSAHIRIAVGEPVVLQLTDDRGNRVEAVSEAAAELARTAGISADRVKEQLQKSGDPLFELESVESDLDGSGFVPVSLLNSLRRDAIEKLRQKRAVKYPDRQALRPIFLPGVFEPRREPRIWAVSVESLEQLKALQGLPIGQIDYPDADTMSDALEIAAGMGASLSVAIPCITPVSEDVWLERLASYDGRIGVRAGNIGQVKLADAGFSVRGDYSLNVFNAASARELNRLGCNRVTASAELNRDELRELRRELNDVPLELIVYGRIPVMTSPICPVGCMKPCNGTRKRSFLLEDDRGYSFPARCREGLFEVYNSRILNLIERVSVMKQDGLAALQLRFTDESPETVRAIAEAFIAAAEGTPESGQILFDKEQHTTGSYKRGVE